MVLPQSIPVGAAFVPPAVAKLVSAGSRFSLARCPGDAPVDAVGFVAGLAIALELLALLLLGLTLQTLRAEALFALPAIENAIAEFCFVRHDFVPLIYRS